MDEKRKNWRSYEEELARENLRCTCNLLRDSNITFNNRGKIRTHFFKSGIMYNRILTPFDYSKIDERDRLKGLIREISDERNALKPELEYVKIPIACDKCIQLWKNNEKKM